MKAIAWLAYRTLPYGFSVAGEEPADVYVELTAPDGVATWTYGSPQAPSSIRGSAARFVALVQSGSYPRRRGCRQAVLRARQP